MLMLPWAVVLLHSHYPTAVVVAADAEVGIVAVAVAVGVGGVCGVEVE